MCKKIQKYVTLIFAAATLALTSITRADVRLPDGDYFDNVEDLRVKVLGGYVGVTRSYNKGAWHFNQAWDEAYLKEDKNWKILRSEDVYVGPERVSCTGGTSTCSARDAHFKDVVLGVGTSYLLGQDESVRQFIRVGDAYDPATAASAPLYGFRWQDKNGNWIDYEIQFDTGGLDYAAILRPIAFGDENNIRVSFRYDASGRRTGVFDHYDNQVLWFTYDAEGRLATARDSENRQVEYRYTNGRLSSVIDVLGHEWTYSYNETGHLASQTDPEGRATQLSYTGAGRVSKVEDALGVRIQYDYDFDKEKSIYYVRLRSGATVKENWYDNAGRSIKRMAGGELLETIEYIDRERLLTDRFGNATKEEYDEWNNLLRRTYPDGAVVTHEYQPGYSRKTKTINENGVVTLYSYDSRGNLLRQTEAAGTSAERITEFDYDAFGRRTSAKIVGDANTALAETRYEYDTRGNIQRETDAEGHVTEYAYDVIGNVLTRKDPRDKLWTNSYDAAGRVTAVANPLGNTTRFEYDRAGLRIKSIDPLNHVVAYGYDVRGKLVSVTDESTKPLRMQYNADGRLVQRTDQEGRATHLTYDAADRLIAVVDGAGNRVELRYQPEAGSNTRFGGFEKPLQMIFPTFRQEFTYDARSRLVQRDDVLSDGSRLVSRFVYDSAGNRTEVVDAAGKATRYVYDTLNRLVETVDAADGLTRYSYDDRHNMLSLTDPMNNTHRFRYDKLDRQIQKIRPLGETFSFIYDGAGNLSERRDAKQQKSTYTYDAAGRLTGIAYVDSLDATTAAQTTSFGYDAAGNLISFSDGGVSGTYGYDFANRKLSETVNYGSFSTSIAYSYFANGAKKSFTGPDGTVTQYSFDQANRLAAMTVAGLGTISTNSFRWNSPTKQTLPGGATREFGYDDLMQLTSIALSDKDGHSLLARDYVHDSVGNITRQSTEHGEYEYGYDDLDRLISADNPRLEDESYSYDAVGNRLASANTTSGWTYDGNNQLQGFDETAFVYDGNGQTVEKTTTAETRKFYYDLRDRLVRVEDGGAVVGRYSHDPFGRRISKQALGQTTHFVYSDEGLVAELDPAGNVQKSYGYEANSSFTTNPVWMKQGGRFYLYHNDHLGTPQLMTDISGEVVWRAEYASFGEADAVAGSVVNNLRFPGQYYDAETGLNQNHFREFDASLGRYVQRDPVGLVGGLNNYTYAHSNPVSYVDPNGLTAVAGAGAAIAFCSRFPAACIGGALAVCKLMGGCEAPAGEDGQDVPTDSGKEEECKERDDDECKKLYAQISAKVSELKKRYSEIIRDPLNLPPEGPMSVAGHQQQFQNQQAHLRWLLNQANSKGCTNYQSDAWEWATKPTPSTGWGGLR